MDNTNSSVTKINNNTVTGSNTFNSDPSTSITIGDNFGIDLNTNVSTHDLESIVLYNKGTQQDRIVGIRMELLNSNDEIVLVTNEITQAKKYFRFDGDQIGKASFSNTASTTAVINDSSNTETLTEVSDLDTLNYLFSKMRLIRTQDNIYNIRIKELQLFINGENKASNTKFGLSYINTAGESNATNDITKINDNNVAYSDTNFISSSTDIGISVGINFNSCLLYTSPSPRD